MCGIDNYATYTDAALPAGVSPSRSLPTHSPTKAPTAPVNANIVYKPVSLPTGKPLSPPTNAPISPTAVPTAAPTPPPSSAPTPLPSSTPTTQPTRKPTTQPTRKPTVAPVAPTASPSLVFSRVVPSTSPTNTESQNGVAVVDTYKPSYRPSRRTRRPTRTGGRRVIPIVWPGAPTVPSTTQTK